MWRLVSFGIKGKKTHKLLHIYLYTTYIFIRSRKKTLPITIYNPLILHKKDSVFKNKYAKIKEVKLIKHGISSLKDHWYLHTVL